MFYRRYNNVLSYIGDAMSLRKAAEMALKYFEDAYGVDVIEFEIKEALRQALAQPEQEPVGYVSIETISSWAKVPSIKWFKKPTQGPLYTAPPKREWVGITYDEVYEFVCTTDSYINFARAIEAKLKERNT